MTTSNNDDYNHDHDHDHDHDHGASITSQKNNQEHNKRESNIYSIMNMDNDTTSMSSLPSSLERSCSIIDHSLSLAAPFEDTDIDSESQNENNENNKNETVAKSSSSSLSSSSSILSTPSSSILPRSATRMPLLPRRGLFQEQDTPRQPPPQHDRARILERYDASLLAFPALPSRRSPVLLPSPTTTSTSGSITNNSNGTTFSLKMKKKKKRSASTKSEHHH